MEFLNSSLKLQQKIRKLTEFYTFLHLLKIAGLVICAYAGHACVRSFSRRRCAMSRLNGSGCLSRRLKAAASASTPRRSLPSLVRGRHYCRRTLARRSATSSDDLLCRCPFPRPTVDDRIHHAGLLLQLAAWMQRRRALYSHASLSADVGTGQAYTPRRVHSTNMCRVPTTDQNS